MNKNIKAKQEKEEMMNMFIMRVKYIVVVLKEMELFM